jgi:hypothetical protein
MSSITPVLKILFGAYRQNGDRKQNQAMGFRLTLATEKQVLKPDSANTATGSKPYFEHWLQTASPPSDHVAVTMESPDGPNLQRD